MGAQGVWRQRQRGRAVGGSGRGGLQGGLGRGRRGPEGCHGDRNEFMCVCVIGPGAPNNDTWHLLPRRHLLHGRHLLPRRLQCVRESESH